MEDYRESAERVISKGKLILFQKHEKRRRIVKYSITAASACCAAALCFGTVSLWDKGVITDNTSMITADIIPDSTAAAQITVTTAPVTSVSKTTAATVTKAETKTAPYTENDTDVYEYDFPAQPEQVQPSETQPAVKTTEPPTLPTEQTTLPEETIKNHTMPHLGDMDDPIWVFHDITYGGMKYSGCGYLRKASAESFYIPWREDLELTVFDPKKNMDITEPVTVMGLRDAEEEQEYIIVCFKNYEMYALYSNESLTEEEPETGPVTEAETDITNAIDNE